MTPTSPPEPRGQRIIIIGAGPTGLGAGYRLRELGHENFTIYESNPFVGGLAHSITDEHGFTWDIGGHVMFSHYSYYDTCFEKLMGDEYTLNNRESWVRMHGTWVPYPFQNNVRYLPKEAAFECIAGLVKAQSGRGRVRSAAEASNFGEFIDAVFGDGIARHFMRPYNFKVWAHPPEMMNKTWIGERVAVIDVERALRNIILGLDDFGWGPNNQFKFPLRGGTGEFYRRFGPVLGLIDDGAIPAKPPREGPDSRIRLTKHVRTIDVDRRIVTFTDGSTDRYDALVSTMPLDVLCRDVLRGDIPGWLAPTACRLLHSAGHMVGIGIKRPCPSSKSWMYFPEPNCPFYRVTYLSNYSPHMTPDRDRYYSLLCETSESDLKPVNHDTIIEDTIRGLENAGLLEPGERDDIVSRWHYRASYAYPTPTVDRDEVLARVIPWLEERGIFSRGRFGMWKYEVSNTDHSLMQGVELANRLLLGDAETTIGVVYKVTEDGRKAAEHERPNVAGSGEKRIIEAKPAEVDTRVASIGDLNAGPIGEEEVGV